MKFEAVIQVHEGIDGAYVLLPFDVEQVFGAKRVKVKAAFDGEPYRGSIVRMNGIFFLGITKEIRTAIGKVPGDSVAVELEKDVEERVITLPEEFQAALNTDETALANYVRLSFSHKRHYQQWVESAKTVVTRESRIVKAVEMLREGKTVK
jgi:hypothetical protein